ncbi:unnamed protein product, partial [Bubo scandiacus]
LSRVRHRLNAQDCTSSAPRSGAQPRRPRASYAGNKGGGGASQAAARPGWAGLGCSAPLRAARPRAAPAPGMGLPAPPCRELTDGLLGRWVPP